MRTAPARGLPVLTYHAIGTHASPTCTDRSGFRATIAALRAAGLHGVDLQDWIARGRPDEPNGFAITFDDGLQSARTAAEGLAAAGIPATVFLVTDCIGHHNDWPGQPRHVRREPLLSWREVADLASAGIRFGAHGRTHVRLDQCDPLRLEEELRGSRDAIEDRLGLPCRLVAFPYGLASLRARLIARRFFDAGFGTRLSYSADTQDPFDIGRIDAHYLRSPAIVDALVGGRLHGRLAIRRVLRALRRGAIGVVSAPVSFWSRDAAA